MPFYPLAIEQLNLSDYDLIISSSYSVAKGVLTHHKQKHICYMHSPVRYAWDLYYQYLKEANLEKGVKSFLVKMVLHYLRMWDISTINRVDHYVANSKYIANRIKKIYNKEATVIYPPVNTSRFSISNTTENYYFTASRMVSYKKMDLIVEAFSKMQDKRLIVSGDGPDFNKIKKIASKNIELLGFLDREEFYKYMSRAKAFVFAAEEDFGITPVEAQACGVPVISYGVGGVLETIKGVDVGKKIDSKVSTGIFFRKQDIQSIIDSVNYFEKNVNSFDKEVIQKNSLKFNEKRFDIEFENFINQVV
jgi:glycosyltransferase involved in cell wall biosynthesis